uniref:Uncharacterized protein n=1 Tax=Haptolina ericina TaxID=156174 RepID=A0A7S3ESX8_9EUKA|eukprot:CAMPEP_0181199456 /NCGR_PEP_ID=MMETSP1096-20121128/17181_1 /TAXON_ID=156174 ORGANISM="Chrysochromulina ericina, Strain CCMP281" /NCGR_SAMPLE_ID=MMETSP1096 /ASSEMBLY_ACC=CAM_ASM_000453 /LENGTH=111 /DNA_ID=CAMNT_0023289629 /DNA_START=12 /DNA_END=347 /DNA_ORIENTATION=+
MACPCSMAMGLVVCAPQAWSSMKKQSPLVQMALLTLVPALLVALVAPESATKFFTCACSCASTRGYVIFAAVAYLMGVKKLVESGQSAKSDTARSEAPVEAPPPAPAAKAA